MPHKAKYVLSNFAKGRKVEAELEVADSEFSRMRGLMLRNKIVPILFSFGYEGIFPIHSYFVKGEFDAAYIGADGRVNELFRRIPPNVPLLTPKKKSSFLLELPPGMTDRLCLEEGDVIRWKRGEGTR